MLEIIKTQRQETRESRNGRLYSGIRTEWIVLEADAIVARGFPTKAEARRYIVWAQQHQTRRGDAPADAAV